MPTVCMSFKHIVMQSPGNILILDDDVGFVETSARFLRRLADGRFEVHTAYGVGQAILQVQDHQIAVAVVDIQMPVVDGLQFISILRRKHPEVKSVVLTAYPQEEYRKACMANGASLYLEKPRSPDEMQAVFKQIVSILDQPVEEGFTGTMMRANLADMLQMLCLSNSTLILKIGCDFGTGRIYVQEGKIIHAEIGELEGQDAFYFLMSLRHGKFEILTFEDPGKQTIAGTWEYLLMESARLIDEDQIATPSAPNREDKEWIEEFNALFFTDGTNVANRGVSEPDMLGDLLDFLTHKTRHVGKVVGRPKLRRVELDGDDFSAMALLEPYGCSFGLSGSGLAERGRAEDALRFWTSKQLEMFKQ